ncbi:AMP-binding protein [Thalassotalea sp. G2M2-11]|uniref:AMP-binding protein n=1 Tax=Thalassotalea sp. G2M2-11 TaxID=2787627 RepID=UPI0019D12004|nr:AMP-binding protein [Thalassotalea sp. G2M2-11]
MFDRDAHLPNLEQTSLVDEINNACKKYAQKSAFNYLGKSYTFAAIDQYAKAFSAWLQQNTYLEPGDRIAIQLPNVIHYPIAAIAAMRMGLVIVNTNPLYTARELSHQFKDSGAKAIVVLEGIANTVNKTLPESNIETVILVSANTLNEHQTISLSHAQQVISFGEVLTKGKSLSPTEVTFDNRALSLLQYTGGTTGVSKGAMLSQHNLLSNIYQVISRIDSVFKPGEEKLVLPLPLYHIFAFTISYMYFIRGCSSILIPNPSDLDQFVQLIANENFTAFAGINTLLIGLTNHEKFKTLNFSKLKFTITGGAATTMAAIKSWHNVTGCKVSEGWGLSESSPALTLNPPSDPQASCAGLPVLSTEIRIVDSKGNSLEQGKEGEVWARGPQVMLGYWQRPEATSETLTADGWLKTGDIGYIQADGFIKLVDRKKDMIIVSGFNVYPNEIEDVLSSHEHVLEAAVIGMPSDKTGESIRAYVTLKSVNCTVELLKQYCREQLTGYKNPKEIIFTQALPKSPVGKILRRELRQQALAEIEKIAEA